MIRHSTTTQSLDHSALALFADRLQAHSDLTAEERAALIELPAIRVLVPPHRDVVRLGERVEHACLVERGLIGRYGETEEGARQFVSVHFAGEMVDLHSLVAPEAITAVSALARTSVLKVPHTALRDLLTRFPRLSRAFWHDCELQAAITAQWLINIGRRDARSRMAHLLCEMAVRRRRQAQIPRHYEFPVTQEQLADLLGLTPVHTNRTLMALRSERLISFGSGQVEILDWIALTAAAQFNEGYLEAGQGSLTCPRAGSPRL